MDFEVSNNKNNLYCDMYILLKDNLLVFRLFTRFPSYQCMQGVFNEIVAPKIEIKTMGRGRKLKPYEEFILTMMRIRLGLLEDYLAVCWLLNQSTVSKILNEWIPFLAKILQPLIKMPPLAQQR